MAAAIPRDSDRLWAAVALGASLANLEIAGAQMGFLVSVQLYPESYVDPPVARVKFARAPRADHPLFSSITQRSANRQPYQTTALPVDVRAELLAIQDGTPGVRLNLPEGQAALNSVAHALAAFDRHAFVSRDIHDYFFHWLRSRSKEIMRSRDGLPIDTLALSPFSAGILRMARAWCVARSLGAIGVDKLAARRAHHLYRQSAAIGIISVGNRTPADAARRGMVFERLWLTATTRGLSLQPLTGAIGIDLSCRGPDAAPPTADVLNLRRRVSAVVPDYLERVPVMCFRIGFAPPPPSRTLRRPVEDVFARVDEQA